MNHDEWRTLYLVSHCASVLLQTVNINLMLFKIPCIFQCTRAPWDIAYFYLIFSTFSQEKHEERDKKLKSIDAKIKASQAAKQQGSLFLTFCDFTTSTTCEGYSCSNTG